MFLGLTEANVVTTKVPKIVSVPVVSELTCLRSSQVLYHIAGDDSICAGKSLNVYFTRYISIFSNPNFFIRGA
jgi:hypothetical protein